MEKTFSGRPPGLADVARVADVSIPTVSRVLTGAARVHPDKRKRVLAAVEELDYRPNSAARALKTGRQSAVAVLVGNTTLYGYAATIQGIEEAARLAGFIVTITVLESPEPELVASSIDLALSYPIGGMIILNFDPQGNQAFRARPSRVPVVVASGSRGRGAPHAVLDDTAAAVEATEYLLSLGHRTVHHIALPSSGRRTGRAAGWRRALENAGAPAAEMWQAGWGPSDGYELALEVLDHDDVTAVLCGNDEIAMGLLRAAHERGRRVPEDLSVVGFDDQPIASLSIPSLTTMQQDFVDLGRRAFGLLSTMLERGRPPRSSITTPSLVVRESTGPPPRRR